MNQATSVSHSSIIVRHLQYRFDQVVNLDFTDMPICDGVEASKRLRIMENKRRVPMVLPSKLHPFGFARIDA